MEYDFGSLCAFPIGSVGDTYTCDPLEVCSLHLYVSTWISLPGLFFLSMFGMFLMSFLGDGESSGFLLGSVSLPCILQILNDSLSCICK